MLRKRYNKQQKDSEWLDKTQKCYFIYKESNKTKWEEWGESSSLPLSNK